MFIIVDGGIINIGGVERTLHIERDCLRDQIRKKPRLAMDVKALLLVAVWTAFADSIPVKQNLQSNYCPQVCINIYHIFMLSRGITHKRRGINLAASHTLPPLFVMHRSISGYPLPHSLVETLRSG